VFHKSCIDPWLIEHRSCPICKIDILKAFGLQVSVSVRLFRCVIVSTVFTVAVISRQVQSKKTSDNWATFLLSLIRPAPLICLRCKALYECVLIDSGLGVVLKF